MVQVRYMVMVRVKHDEWSAFGDEGATMSIPVTVCRQSQPMTKEDVVEVPENWNPQVFGMA